MSKYTTGEIAKLCGVSVRTVQYYLKVADDFIQKMIIKN